MPSIRTRRASATLAAAILGSMLTPPLAAQEAVNRPSRESVVMLRVWAPSARLDGALVRWDAYRGDTLTARLLNRWREVHRAAPPVRLLPGDVTRLERRWLPENPGRRAARGLFKGAAIGFGVGALSGAVILAQAGPYDDAYAPLFALLTAGGGLVGGALVGGVVGSLDDGERWGVVYAPPALGDWEAARVAIAGSVRPSASDTGASGTTDRASAPSTRAVALAQVAPGTPIRITAPALGIVRLGTVHAGVGDDSLRIGRVVLPDADGVPTPRVAIPLALLTHVEAKGSTAGRIGRHALWGVAIGGLVGLAAQASGQGRWHWSDEVPLLFSPATQYAAIGGLAGGVIGVARGPEWKEVPLPAAVR